MSADSKPQFQAASVSYELAKLKVGKRMYLFPNGGNISAHFADGRQWTLKNAKKVIANTKKTSTGKLPITVEHGMMNPFGGDGRAHGWFDAASLQVDEKTGGIFTDEVELNELGQADVDGKLYGYMSPEFYAENDSGGEIVSIAGTTFTNNPAMVDLQIPQLAQKVLAQCVAESGGTQQQQPEEKTMEHMDKWFADILGVPQSASKDEAIVALETLASKVKGPAEKIADLKGNEKLMETHAKQLAEAEAVSKNLAARVEAMEKDALKAKALELVTAAVSQKKLIPAHIELEVESIVEGGEGAQARFEKRMELSPAIVELAQGSQTLDKKKPESGDPSTSLSDFEVQLANAQGISQEAMLAAKVGKASNSGGGISASLERYHQRHNTGKGALN